MTNRFLISVAAAALIAGTGFANAQGSGGMSREGGAGSSVQHSAPPAGGGAMSAPQRGDTSEKAGAAAPEKAGASESKSMGGKQAEDNLKVQKSQQNTASDSDRAKAGKDMKAEGRDSKSGTVGQAAPSEKSGATTQSREDRTGTPNKGAMDSKSQTTTGNAATSATAAPPAEKRTQIVSAIKQEHIQETTNVNFNISVGAVVPATVQFHPIPVRIVEIYPEWRGYEVIFVKGRYIIVRPQTHEIVYIIEG